MMAHETIQTKRSINNFTKQNEELVVFLLQWFSILVDFDRRRHFWVEPAILDTKASSIFNISSKLDAFVARNAVDSPVVVRLWRWANVIISVNWWKMIGS